MKFLIIIIVFLSFFGFSYANLQNANILAERGIIENHNNDPENYKLDSELTRGEMLKIMMNISGQEVPEICDGIFNDLTSNDWACKYAENGVKYGYIANNPEFKPNSSVSYAEALKMIFKALEIPVPQTDIWIDGYIMTALETGIITSTPKDYNSFIIRGDIFDISVQAITYISDLILKETIIYDESFSRDPNLVSLDVYFKNSFLDAPVVVYVHGGAWSVGDKANNIEDKVSHFVNNGYVFVSMNYRLTNQEGTNTVKHPDHIEDVAAGVFWVQENISTYQGDANKISLMGHSAGAHLVSLLVTNTKYAENAQIELSNIKGVISLDTRSYDITERIETGGNTEAFLEVFTEDSNNWKDASPIEYVSSGTPMFLLVYRNATGPLQAANDFSERLYQMGVEYVTINTGSMSHSDVNDQVGKQNDTIITPTIDIFLKEIFK